MVSSVYGLKKYGLGLEKVGDCGLEKMCVEVLVGCSVVRSSLSNNRKRLELHL